MGCALTQGTGIPGAHFVQASAEQKKFWSINETLPIPMTTEETELVKKCGTRQFLRKCKEEVHSRVSAPATSWSPQAPQQPHTTPTRIAKFTPSSSTDDETSHTDPNPNTPLNLMTHTTTDNHTPLSTHQLHFIDRVSMTERNMHTQQVRLQIKEKLGDAMTRIRKSTTSKLEVQNNVVATQAPSPNLSPPPKHQFTNTTTITSPRSLSQVASGNSTTSHSMSQLYFSYCEIHCVLV